MKNKFQRINILLIILIALLTSCDSMLKEEKFDFIASDDIEDSNSGSDLLVTGIYNKLSVSTFQYGTFPVVLDFDCDYSTGPEWAFSTFGAGNYQANTWTSTMWESLYEIIQRANYAEEAINNMKNISLKNRQNALGEIKFLKAFSYFYLVRAFGEIPIHKASVNSGKESSQQPKKPIIEVYDYIIEMLLDAENTMYKNTDSEFKAGHASAGAAASLLAKVYVTMASGATPQGEQVIVKGGRPFTTNASGTRIYTNPVSINVTKDQVKGYESLNHKEYFRLARDKAKEVIDGVYGTYDLLAFDNLWTQASKNKVEHIFSHQAKSGDDLFGVTYPRGYSGLYNSSNQILDGLWYGCRDHWYKLFEESDYRVSKGVMHRWIRTSDAIYNAGAYYPNNDTWKNKVKGYTKPDGTVVPPEAPYNDGIAYKTADNQNYLAYLTKFSFVSDNKIIKTDINFPFLRFADILLIYAEAANEANEGPTQDAVNALNRVRIRSNATPKVLTGDGNINDKVLFRSAVIEERAMELAEEGDRRWDLIRWGIYLQVMNSIGGIDEINVSKARQEKHLLFPLPISEINTNKSITENNPGW